MLFFFYNLTLTSVVFESGNVAKQTVKEINLTLTSVVFELPSILDIPSGDSYLTLTSVVFEFDKSFSVCASSFI